MNEQDYFEVRENTIAENRRLSGKAKKYSSSEELLKQNLKLNWELDIVKMNFNALKTEFKESFIQELKQKYSVIHLKLDSFLEVVSDKFKEKFPSDKLFNEELRSSSNIARLLEFVEQDMNIIPPIAFYNDGIFGIKDGNHRIALSRFLDLSEIPFGFKQGFRQASTIQVR